MSNVTVVPNAKKSHYSNLVKDVNDNKKFWKIVKPLFSDKVTTNENITLLTIITSSPLTLRLLKSLTTLFLVM